MTRSTRTAFAGAVALSFIAVACGSSKAEQSADAPATTVAAVDATADAPATTAAAADSGAAVCPEKLVIQTDWWPEIEHGGTYQLIGPNGTADKATFRYSGPIDAKYAVGGIKTVEVRSGGDAIQFNQVTSEMYTKEEITLGYVNLSDVVRDSKVSPVVGVSKTLEINPQMLMWDPAQITIDKPEDFAKSKAKILHFDKTTYIDWMVAKGYVTADQLDPTYGGSPSVFIEKNGNFIQQGFATNEVWDYENTHAWKDGKPAPVKYLLMDDIGFRDYPAMMTVRKDKLEALAPCLKVLVPKLAQAWVDYFAAPDAMNAKLVDITTTYDTYWHVNADLNAAGMALIEEKKIGANGPAGDYCSFDEKRAQGLVDEVKGVFTARGVDIAADVAAATVIDNSFCAGAPGR